MCFLFVLLDLVLGVWLLGYVFYVFRLVVWVVSGCIWLVWCFCLLALLVVVLVAWFDFDLVGFAARRRGWVCAVSCLCLCLFMVAL